MDAKKPDIFDRIMQLPLLRRLNPLYKKHKSVLLYSFFGGLTTLVSIGSFILANTVLDHHIANLISWICAVTFAYVTNRIWVFDSQAKGAAIFREVLTFFGGRLFSLGVEEVILLVCVDWLQLNSTVIKLVAQIVVLLLNFFISKFLVFRKRSE